MLRLSGMLTAGIVPPNVASREPATNPMTNTRTKQSVILTQRMDGYGR
jgi:hypothetical protein